ncbi:MAG: hypothetical protein ACOYD4_08785 [Solirubrobacterales bacterium]
MTRFARLSLAALVGAVLTLSLVATLAPAAGAAVTPAPRWDVQMIAKPTNFKIGTFLETTNHYEFVFTNIGGAPWTGPVEVSVKVASGVTVESVWPNGTPFAAACAPANAGTEVVCVVPEVRPFNADLEFAVAVSNAAPEVLTTEIEITGGGAPPFQGSFTNRVSPEKAPFSITGFSSAVTGPAGESDQTAGDHPTLSNTLLTGPMETVINVGEELPVFLAARGPIKNDKDIVVDLPVGVVGNPTAAPKCPIQVFLAQQLSSSNCPPGSQVGVFTVSGTASVYQGEAGGAVGERNPIFNLAPEPGYAAEFGFYDQGLSHGILAPATLAHTDQGYVVRVVSSELITGVFGPYFLQTSFFGNPQKAAGLPGVGKAFLTNSSNCSGQPLRTEVHLDTWSNPAPVPLRADGSRDFGAANFSDPQWYSSSSDAPPVSGCESLHFNPTIRLRPDETASDSPSGLGVKISVPQSEAPEGLATPPLRDATVALPAGLVVNPSSGDGLLGCSVAQLAPNSTAPGQCPDASKLGTATLATSLIDHKLEGSVFLGTPQCAPCGNADAAAGRLLKLYIEINDPATGVVVKLPGTVAADPATGQLTATFKDNPQLPFEDLELHFKAGARAPLTTPPACGEYTTTTDLKPWSAPQSGPDAAPQTRFSLSTGPGGSACASSEAGLANASSFEAGTAAPIAGTYSPFVLKVSRENGSQRIGSIDATLPEGLVGKLAGTPYCAEASIAAAANRSGTAERANPSCPLASEVGVVNIGAGSGAPFYVQGHAYLAGPYKGAPLSLEIITPAVAGPFDLGTVAVRTALYVDPITTQIHAVGDPIPSILAGIPLDVRSIALNMSKPKFTLNPSSCNPMQVLAATTSTLGQTLPLQKRFQVGGCSGLGFAPKLALRFSGAPTHRGGHPKLRAVLTARKGDANIARTVVTLPPTELLENAHIGTICTRPQYAEDKCPAKSVYGYAKAWTPLLEKPLQGPVYLRANGGARDLPDLVAKLDGQIHVDLVGYIDSVNARIRNTFATVPDAPVSKFELRMKGGDKGLLVNNTEICRAAPRANVKFTGQNGKFHEIDPAVQVEGCGKGK